MQRHVKLVMSLWCVFLCSSRLRMESLKGKVREIKFTLKSSQLPHNQLILKSRRLILKTGKLSMFEYKLQTQILDRVCHAVACIWNVLCKNSQTILYLTWRYIVRNSYNLQKHLRASFASSKIQPSCLLDLRSTGKLLYKVELDLNSVL